MTSSKNTGTDGAGSTLSTMAGPSGTKPLAAPKGANPVEARLLSLIHI